MSFRSLFSNGTWWRPFTNLCCSVLSPLELVTFGFRTRGVRFHSVLLLFRHSAKSSIAQEERLATLSTRWHGSTCYTRQKLGCTHIESTFLPTYCKRRAHLLLRCERDLPAPLSEDKEGSMGLMLWVKSSTTRLPSNILYTPLAGAVVHMIAHYTKVKVALGTTQEQRWTLKCIDFQWFGNDARFVQA